MSQLLYKHRKLSWIPDVPDCRDIIYKVSTPIKLPVSVDLCDNNMPAVYDQGSLGSCTANAIGSAFQYSQLKSGVKNAPIPSRLFIYFNEREMEGTINQDAGAMIRDGIKSIVKQGVCPEFLWPYDVEKFKRRPAAACYKAALKNQALTYMRLVNAERVLKTCLAEGYPFVFGFAVYENFYTIGKDGIMPMPAGKMLGGHAVKCVGYKIINGKLYFRVKNSWGSLWSDGGYFWMPAEYICNMQLCDDFWVIRTVENGK